MKKLEKLGFFTAIWVISLVLAYAVGRSNAPPAVVDTAESSTLAGAGAAAGDSQRSPRRSAVSSRASTGSPIEPSVFSVAGDFGTPEADNADRALSSILRDADPVRRLQQFGRLLNTLDAEAIAEALDAFESLPHGLDRTQEFNLLLYRYGQLDGEGAVAYASQLGEEWLRRDSLNKILSGWATKDPDAALAWARAESDEADNPLLLGVINGIAQNDVTWASSLVESLPYGRNRGRGVDLVLDAYLQQGVEPMVGWAEGLQEEKLRSGVMRRVADRLAGLDPAAYADWPLSLNDAGLQQLAATSYAQQWARSAPEEAAAWVSALDEDTVRDHAAAGVLRSWARRDHESALAWIELTPTADATDQVITRFLHHFGRHDPETALAWAHQIGNDATRNAQVQRFQARIDSGDTGTGGVNPHRGGPPGRRGRRPDGA